MKKTLKEEMQEAIEKETLDSWTTANEKDVRVVYTNDFVTSCASIAEKHINNERAKLKALLEGLETQHIEKLIYLGKIGDFRNYGTAYISSVRDKVKIARLEGMIEVYRMLPNYKIKTKLLEQELEKLKKQ